MGKKILDSKALYVVLSIIIAVFMWGYVMSMDGSEEEQTIYNIPIQFFDFPLIRHATVQLKTASSGKAHSLPTSEYKVLHQR